MLYVKAHDAPPGKPPPTRHLIINTFSSRPLNTSQPLARRADFTSCADLQADSEPGTVCPELWRTRQCRTSGIRLHLPGGGAGSSDGITCLEASRLVAQLETPWTGWQARPGHLRSVHGDCEIMAGGPAAPIAVRRRGRPPIRGPDQFDQPSASVPGDRQRAEERRPILYGRACPMRRIPAPTRTVTPRLAWPDSARSATTAEAYVPAPVGRVLPEMGRDQRARPVEAAAHVRRLVDSQMPPAGQPPSIRAAAGGA